MDPNGSSSTGNPDPFTPEQLQLVQQLIAQAQTQVVAQAQAALQMTNQAAQAAIPSPFDVLNSQLRKVKPEGITPLDVGVQGAAYRSWAVAVERALYMKHGLWEIIMGTSAAPQGLPSDPAVIEWNIKDKAATIFLMQAMTPARRERVPPTHSANQIWEQLRVSSFTYTMESLHATTSQLMHLQFDPEEEDIDAF